MERGESVCNKIKCSHYARHEKPAEARLEGGVQSGQRWRGWREIVAVSTSVSCGDIDAAAHFCNVQRLGSLLLTVTPLLHWLKC